MHLAAGRIVSRVYGSLYTQAYNQYIYCQSHFTEMIHFYILQANTGTNFDSVVGRNKDSKSDGKCGAHNLTSQ
jgi:hypothetical protein